MGFMHFTRAQFDRRTRPVRVIYSLALLGLFGFGLNSQPLFSQPIEDELKIGVYVCIDISLSTINAQDNDAQKNLKDFLDNLRKRWQQHQTWKLGVILFAGEVLAVSHSMQDISDLNPKEILEKIRQIQSDPTRQEYVGKTDFKTLEEALLLKDKPKNLRSLAHYDQFDRNLFIIYTDGIPDPNEKNLQGRVNDKDCVDFVSRLDDALGNFNGKDKLARICMVLTPATYLTKYPTGYPKEHQKDIAKTWRLKNNQSFRFQVFSVNPPSDSDGRDEQERLDSFDEREEWVAKWIGTKLSIAPLGLWEGNGQKILKLRLRSTTIPSRNDTKKFIEDFKLEIVEAPSLLLRHNGRTLLFRETETDTLVRIDLLKPDDEYQFKYADKPGLLNKMFTQYWSYSIGGKNSEKLIHFLGARAIKIPLVNLDGLTIMLQEYESDIAKMKLAKADSKYNYYFQKLEITQNPHYEPEFPIFIKIFNEFGSGIADSTIFRIPLLKQSSGLDSAGIILKLKSPRFAKDKPLLFSSKIEVADSTAAAWIESAKKLSWRPFEILDQPWLYIEHELSTIFYFNWPLYEKCLMYAVIAAGILLAVFLINFAFAFGESQPGDIDPPLFRWFDPRNNNHRKNILRIWLLFFGVTIFVDVKLYNEISNFSQSITLDEFVNFYLPLPQYIYFIAVNLVIYIFIVTNPMRFPQKPMARIKHLLIYPLGVIVCGVLVAAVTDIKLFVSAAQFAEIAIARLKLGEGQSD